MNERCNYLLSRFSHEVRNPLTLIYSSLQLIEQDCPDVTDTFLWTQVKQDIQDTIFLLKDLSSPEKPSASTEQPIFVSRILEQLTASCRAYMKSKQVALHSEITSGLPPLMGNETKLKEAILNLLLNACDAAACSDTGHGSVLLTACAQENQLCIHIRDNGSGIPEEYRTSLFTPFTTHKASGTGLGLSVVKNVVGQFGGTISFETCTKLSEAFTDFCLLLPFSQPQEETPG